MKNRKLTFVFVYLFAFCMMATVPAFAGEKGVSDDIAGEIVEEDGGLRAVPDIIIEDEMGVLRSNIIGGEIGQLRIASPDFIVEDEGEVRAVPDIIIEDEIGGI